VDARLVAQGTRLVSADRAGWLRAFDASTGIELGATWVPGGVIHVLATHADATLVVAVSDSGEASTWDVARPELPRSPVPPGHGGARTTCAAFLPDGLRVALGSSSGSVDVRDARTLERTVELVFGLADGRTPGVSALAVSPRDGELAVVTDRVLRLRRIGAPDDSGGPHTVFFVRALAWDPTARRVLALGRDSAPRSVRVVDRETGATTSLQNAHKGAITCAAFTADGAIVVTGAVDGSVHAWSARDGTPVVQSADLGAPVASVACVEGPAGPSIAVGLQDGGVRVFPFDPLSAARRRKPRDLAEWEVNRERALAAPLPFD
jgi:WD40 repeat protein